MLRHGYFFIVKNIWKQPNFTRAINTKCVFIRLAGGTLAGLLFELIFNKLKPRISRQSDQPNKSAL